MSSVFDGVNIDPPVPNRVQFARLLWALKTIVNDHTWNPIALDDLVDRMANLTCMTPAEVAKILNRAEDAWIDIRGQAAKEDQIEAIRQEAAEIYEEENVIEIDPNAEVVECVGADGEDNGKPGAWVQAWLWVDADAKKTVCPLCGEETDTSDGICKSCAEKEGSKK